MPVCASMVTVPVVATFADSVSVMSTTEPPDVIEIAPELDERTVTPMSPAAVYAIVPLSLEVTAPSNIQIEPFKEITVIADAPLAWRVPDCSMPPALSMAMDPPEMTERKPSVVPAATTIAGAVSDSVISMD